MKRFFHLATFLLALALPAAAFAATSTADKGCPCCPDCPGC